MFTFWLLHKTHTEHQHQKYKNWAHDSSHYVDIQRFNNNNNNNN